MTLASPSAESAAASTLDDPAWPADTTAPGDAARLLATVVGWHNRHPLARRLVVADVGGLGTLAVPVLAPPSTAADGAPPGWKHRLRHLVVAALAWRPGRRPGVAFAEPAVIPGVSAGRVSRFAHACGQAERPSPPNWPQRVLPVVDDAAVETRHLFAAAFKTGPQATRRVLVGTGRSAPVLGQRQWSPLRLGAAAGVSLALAAGVGAWWLRGPASSIPSVAHPSGVAAAHPASGAASSPVLASAPAAGTTPASAVGSASTVPAPDEALLAAAGAASAADAASSPASAAVAAAVNAGPVLEAHATSAAASAPAGLLGQAAEPASGHATSSHAAAPPPLAHAPEPAAAKLAPRGPAATAMPALRTVAAARTPAGSPRSPQAATAPAPTQTRHHALVSPPTWRRADLDRQRQRLMRWMAQERSPLQLDVLRRPDGEVLALWPLATATDAELMSRRLQRAGVTLVVMDF